MAPDAFEVGGRRLTAKTFVIATGSRPAVPPVPGLDTVPYLTNETVFDLREQVPSLIVVGSGPIGSELAQAFRRLGSEVTVVDMASGILPREDADLAAVVHAQLVAEGIRFHFDCDARPRRGTRRRHRRDRQGQGRRGGNAARRRTCCSRRAAVLNVEGLGLDAAGRCHGRGRIVVDDRLRTSQLAHLRRSATPPAACSSRTSPSITRASCCATRSSGCKWTKPSSVLPWCTYTDPELARVGLSETEAKEGNVDHRVYRFPFEDIDRARAEGETEGFAKIVTDPEGQAAGRRHRRTARGRADRRVRSRAHARACPRRTSRA